MIYVHEEVPALLSGILVPKIDCYLGILEEITGQNRNKITGRSYCAAVSDVLAVALRRRGISAGICYGAYFNGFREGHQWVSADIDGEEYSIDLTHRQTGSDFMAILVPSGDEHRFNLYRNWKDACRRGRISRESRHELKGRGAEMTELFSH